MDIGMLWYDDDAKRSLAEKVARAADYYKTKYGAAPSVCFVNPGMLPPKSTPDLAAGVYLRPSRSVMVNHFWIGVGDGAARAGARKGGAARQKQAV